MKFTKTEKLLLEEMEQAKKDYSESVKEYGEENGLSKFFYGSYSILFSICKELNLI